MLGARPSLLPLAQAGEASSATPATPLDHLRGRQRHRLPGLGDRQLRPLRRRRLLEHLRARLGSRSSFGFLIAFAMALVSHGRRWLIPVFTGATGVIYTVPSIALFLLLLPITGRGTDDRDDRAHPLHAADHLPQHHRRARQRARPGERRRARDGDDRPAAALAGRAAAGAARDRRRRADRDRLDGRDRDARGLRRGRRARRRDLQRHHLQDRDRRRRRSRDR